MMRRRGLWIEALGKPRGADDVGQRGDKKTSFTFGTGDLSGWGLVGIFAFEDSRTGNNQAELSSTRKGILIVSAGTSTTDAVE